MNETPIIFAIRAVNVPETLQHRARKLEIEELPDYLQVQGNTPGMLYLINFGNGTPGADAAGYPWLKTAADGQPDGLYIKYNGAWYPAHLHGVEAPHINYPMIQTGELTLTATNANVDHADAITFTTEFASTPKVFFSLRAASADISYHSCLVVPTQTKVSVNKLICNVASSDLTFDWLAIGARNPAA